MNPLVKSLLARAHLDAPDIKDTNWIAERFAQLILLECNMALQPYLRDMISRGKACDLINDHFGVE